MRNFRIFSGYVLLIGIAISMLYPFFAMVNLSFADDSAIFSQTSKLFYGNLTLENYQNVFAQIPLARYFFNSLVVASVTTFFTVIFAAFAGYAFARLNFKYKNVLFLTILITMLIPPQVRDIFLLWLSRALERTDHRAKTEDGQIYYLEQADVREYCTLRCTDGTFQMPAYTMIFEENEDR